jgi:ABC-2 type transport system permease protein
LLFAALEGAATYLEERESGLLDRLATSPGGAGAIMDGKFLFLVARGFVQVTVIYAVAWAAFDIDVIQHAAPWFAATVAAATSAAGLSLGFVAVCRTKEQARTIGQMLVLVLSAVGGSMVPRYLMPPEFRMLGWITPNTWALEAYGGIFQRGDAWQQLATPVGVLTAAGLAGLLVARVIASSRV